MDAVDQLRQSFAAVADPSNAAPMAAYMKHIAPFVGVHADLRRRVVRTWCSQLSLQSADDVCSLATRLCREPEREFHYAAADVAAYWLRLLDASFIADHAATLLLQTPWWDSVDLWGSDVINPLCNRYECATTLWHWNGSGNRWLIRASIQHQRGRKQHYDVDLVFALCAPHVADSEFFVAKAIGWALRDIAKYQPARVQEFVAAHPQLSTVARREALRRIERGLLQ
ncbi:MAG: DNA alkylation repair protein [Roseiflexaceae bacterium]